MLSNLNYEQWEFSLLGLTALWDVIQNGGFAEKREIGTKIKKKKKKYKQLISPRPENKNARRDALRNLSAPLA